MRKPRRKIKEGDRFGRLIVLGLGGYSGTHRKFKTRCDCGTEKEVSGGHMINGYIRSCGCLFIESHTKEAGHRGYRKAYVQYRANARNRKLPFEISLEEFKEIVKLDCDYCGTQPKLKNPYLKDDGSPAYTGNRMVAQNTIDRAWIKINGVDRVDSTKGYVADNMVPCCSVCNKLKMELEREEFLKHIYRIARFKAEREFTL